MSDPASTPAAPGADRAPPFRVAVVPVTPFQQNASILFDVETRRGAVIDPGGDLPRLLAAIDETGADIEKIVLTHGHIDHAGGAAALKRDLEARSGRRVPVEGPHRADAGIIADIPKSALRFNLSGMESVVPDRWLDEGDALSIAGLDFDIHHCPGHSPGSLVYVQKAWRFALMGDVLFQGSIGRTDFPYGDHAALIRAIKEKLLPLGDDIVFLPGHGGMSTLGAERTTNPYLR
jgi:glyoxylase-like metal-dependent hydrolase (beta-lactamase superfamily II)